MELCVGVCVWVCESACEQVWVSLSVQLCEYGAVCVGICMHSVPRRFCSTPRFQADISALLFGQIWVQSMMHHALSVVSLASFSSFLPNN